MKNLFNQKYIDIDGTEFLTIINRKLETKNYFPNFKEDIESISRKKEIILDNIQELFTYLVYSYENYEHYYNRLKHLIQGNVCPILAIENIDKEIEENEKLFLFLNDSLEYEFTVAGMIKVDWREDNEK